MSGIYNGLALDCLDVEGRLDWMDGWHEESGLGFQSKRAPGVNRAYLMMNGKTKLVPASEAMEAGRMERREVREARGV